MPAYVVLYRFTNEGRKSIKGTAKRAQQYHHHPPAQTDQRPKYTPDNHERPQDQRNFLSPDRIS
jgi:hypothetical protein